MSFDICLTFNEAYAPHAAALAVSIMDHHRSNEKVFFHLICNVDVAESTREYFRSACRQWGADLEFIDTDEAAFDGFPLFRGNRSAYIRLSLGNLLSHLDRVLYLDCDIVVNTDLSPLFEIDLGSRFAAARCWDFSLLPSPLYPKGCDTFNSGVMLVNLARMREADIFNRSFALMKQWMADYSLKVCSDEEILNTLFAGNIIRIPYTYNVSAISPYRAIRREREYRLVSPYNSREEFDEAYNDPKLVHFIAKKPWCFDTASQRHYWHDLYWKYQRMTPFYEDVARSYREQERLFARFVDVVPEGDAALKNARERCLNVRDLELIFASLSPDKKLVFFGAGPAGLAALECIAPYQKLSEITRSVDCFIDNDPNKGGTFVEGIPVRGFADLLDMAPDVEIVLSSTHVAAVLDQLHAHGLAESVKGSFWLDRFHFASI